MRLPDINKISVQIGNPVPKGYTTDIIEFSLGEDLVFTGYAEIEGSPIDINHWTLKAIIKSNSFAELTVWEGVINNGLTLTASKPGYYKIIVPKEVFNTYAPGTYWLGLIAKEKLGQGKESLDRSIIVANVPFSLVQAVGSNTVIDGRIDAERTVPYGVNIIKL